MPKDFEKCKERFDWPVSENISFRYFSEKEISKMQSGNKILRGIRESLLLKNKIKEVLPDKVFLSTITVFIPFICLFLGLKVKISGILYDVHYLLDQKNSRKRHFLDMLRFNVAINSNCIEKLFVLNDNDACFRLNSLFKTQKFCFIVDPVPDLSGRVFNNLRASLNIPATNTIYLHFGGMTERKGTLDILSAIMLAKQDEFKDKTFIFAGRIYEEIHAKFYSLLAKAQRNCQIIVFDKFCSYDFLYNLCYTTDVILLPYKLTTLSSGVLGYASAFDKMVIGPSGGLIGSLIKKYHLGIALCNLNAGELYDCIKGKVAPIHSKVYSSYNSIDRFINTIFDVIG